MGGDKQSKQVESRRNEKSREKRKRKDSNSEKIPKSAIDNCAEKNDDKVDEDSSMKEEVDELTIAYYKRVQDSLGEELENTKEDQELFFDNVFQQLASEAIIISQNPITSHIVEKLLNYANAKNLTLFVDSLNKCWTVLLKDKFASHVVQTVLSRSFTLLYSDNNELNTDFIIDISKHVIEGLDEYVGHLYSSHVLRKLMEILGGIQVNENVLRSRMSRDVRTYKQTAAEHKSSIKTSEAPDTFIKLFNQLADKILNSEKITDLIHCPLAGPVLQTVLLVLKSTNPRLCDDYCRQLIAERKILLECEDITVAPEFTVGLPKMAIDVTSSYLLDQLMKLLPDDRMAEVFTDWEEKFVGLALHPNANFVLQKFLDRITSDQFKLVYSSIKPHVEDLMAVNHLGLVVKMAECAHRHGVKQKGLMKHIFEAFHCQTPKERQIHCVPLIVSLTAYEVLYPDDEDKKTDDSKITEYNLHGSLLLQQLVKFTDPSIVVASLLALSSSQLCQMALNPIASHVIEAFVRSESVDEKCKDRFYEKLQDHYVDIACHKTGSRTFDTIWVQATLTQKAMITECLSKMAAKLSGDRYGQFIHKKCAVAHFAQKRSLWENVITGQVKKKRMFDDIISGTIPEKRQKKTPVGNSSNRTSKSGNREENEMTSSEKQLPIGQSVKSLKTYENSSADALKRPSAKKRRRMKKMGLWNLSSANE